MAENVRVLLKEEEVEKRIAEVAAMINRDYEGKEVHLICILKGGVFFTCELAKRLTVPVSMDFMSVSSYGSGTESSGVVRIVKDLDESITGKNVLIVEEGTSRFFDPKKDYLYPIPSNDIAQSRGNVEQNPNWK